MARERIALAAGAALLVAGVILVIAVLPAEYGVDPLGIGASLGLTAMGDIRQAGRRVRSDRGAAAGGGADRRRRRSGPFQQETVELQARAA